LSLNISKAVDTRDDLSSVFSKTVQDATLLAGHESFAAAEGAIKIAAKADKVRKEPLRCILNGRIESERK